MRKYFGTDGVRGVANKELTCDLVEIQDNQEIC